MKKVINFGPGPAKLPVEVIERAQRELLNYDNRVGISILEMSHRSADFSNLLKETEKLLRELMEIPDEYAVLFMHGGGTGQFAAIAQNLGFLAKNQEKPTANYVVTGGWSDKAAKEAAKFITVNQVLKPQKPYAGVVPLNQWNIDSDAAYLYYCANETIHGVEFTNAPEVGDVALVADVSSNILSRPFDVSKHALVFAGTQKNIGIAGLTIVIVRKDLMGKAHPLTPSILDYEEIYKNNSVYNTPPCFAIYITKLVLEWIRDQGGPQAIFERNRQKAERIYNIIDSSDQFYTSVVDKSHRSQMNIPFRIGQGANGTNGNEELEAAFLKLSQARNMISLKGHRSVGGIRASLYNAVTLDEVEALANLMEEFKANNNKT
ncbi:aminotransferase class-V domain-containing protein [Ditylenchus destructor]|uniref:phosphoserine transaminase n=1 Tax=Ditylenchus destructor TaxID=166010 RepID=A0AAD4RCZ0_9BILA|nr:aminotransferase class-V domain-containing protein [Ditylenchus destructor]